MSQNFHFQLRNTEEFNSNIFSIIDQIVYRIY